MERLFEMIIIIMLVVSVIYEMGINKGLMAIGATLIILGYVYYTALPKPE